MRIVSRVSQKDAAQLESSARAFRFQGAAAAVTSSPGDPGTGGEVRGAGWENRMRSEAFLSELRRLRLQNQREAMAAQSQGGLMFAQEYEASVEVLTLAELRARLATLASPSLSVKFFSAKELDEFLTLPEIRGVRTLKIEFQFAHPWLIRYRLRRTEPAAVLGLSHA